MIVALIAAIGVLFGSGSEVFFLPDFEKGVKEYVIGKERKKEVTNDLKNAKDISKEFHKERKSDLKGFKSMYSSRETNEEDLTEFFTKIQAKRVSMQKELIEARLRINKKIESSEWYSIIAFSSASHAKTLKKAQKRKEKKNSKKVKDPFENTLKSIAKVGSSENKKNLIKGLNDFKVKVGELSSTLEKVYANNKFILTKKETTKQDLMKVTEEINELRNTTFKEVVSFHVLLKKLTNEEEWKKVMKSFNKDLAETIKN